MAWCVGSARESSEAEVTARGAVTVCTAAPAWQSGKCRRWSGTGSVAGEGR